MARKEQIISKRIRLELDSRPVGEKLKEVNIQEYLNILFPLIESLRVVLRENNKYFTSTIIGRFLYDYIIDMIDAMLDFEFKWNYAYSTWHSSFKADKSNRKEYLNTGPNKFYEIQTYFPESSTIAEDIDRLNKELSLFIEKLERIESFGWKGIIFFFILNYCMAKDKAEDFLNKL
jgi:hypothetical protein